MKQKFNAFLENELNKNQIEAVKDKDGAFLVIAGAGSGKTRVITARITNLIINHGVNPSEIIALTFTNKAAREMKERIQKFLPDQTNLPFIGTFHSFSLIQLKKFRSFHNIENFSILDGDDQLKIVKMILNKFALNKDYNAKQIQYAISDLKNRLSFDSLTLAQDGRGGKLLQDDRAGKLIQGGQAGKLIQGGQAGKLIQGGRDSELIREELYNHTNKKILEIFHEYEKEKKNNKCLDFDDLLIETLKLFKKNKEFKENFQNKIKHILVDEYQDTNTVQHELLKEMAISNAFILDSICAVGDEDQSIYSWRGAIVENINHFKKDFKDTKLIKIEQNYRSVDQILDVANHVIKHNKNRNKKNLWSEKKAENRILRITNFSGTKEAEMVAKYAQGVQKKQRDQIKNSSIAVLYRTHFQSRLIEEMLLREGINYQIIGGIQFYERKEIKDILAYLKLIINPFDKVSFFRVINCPTRGIGQKSQDLIALKWDKEPLLDFRGIIKKIIDEKILPNSKCQKLIELPNLLDRFSENDSAAFTVKELIDHLEYVLYLKSEYDISEAHSRIENLNELIRAASFDSHTKLASLDIDRNKQSEQSVRNIRDFLDEIAILQDQLNDKDKEDNPIQLMTLHAAKGLEFDHVIIIGLEEGLLPSNRSLESTEQIEEERRLFYVGVTRAKEYLILSHARLRNTYGQTGDQISSRFLDEVPNHKIHTFQYTNYNDLELESILYQFLEIKQKNVFKPSVLTFEESTEATSYRPTKKIVNGWKKNHFAKHKTFGVGLIKEIEEKPKGTILTIQFKNIGIKKIDSKFLEMV